VIIIAIFCLLPIDTRRQTQHWQRVGPRIEPAL